MNSAYDLGDVYRAPEKAYEIYDAIVVGCGTAGLTTILRLQEEEFNILGLEKFDRIQCATHSGKFEGKTIDSGFEWYWNDENSFINLAKCRLKELNGFNIKFIDSNSFEDSDHTKNIINKLYEVFEFTLNSHPEYDLSNKQNNLFWHKIFTEVSPSERGFYIAILDYLLNTTATSINGLSPRELEGNIYSNGKIGYKLALNELMNKYSKQDSQLPLNIHFNKDVRIVDYTNNSFIKILCSDDSQYLAKHVIIATSLSTLKYRYSELFNPKLSENLINAIKEVDYGTLTKIFLVFDHPWWNAVGGWYGLRWKDEDYKALDSSWLHGVAAFSTLEQHPNILCCWILNKNSIHLKQIDDEKFKTGIYQVLKHFFENMYSISHPQIVLRSEWMIHINSKGLKNKKPVTTPIYNANGIPVICFSGGFTSSNPVISLYDIIETGFREADRIVGTKKQIIECNIVIVGAGIAGLMAARELAKVGFNNFYILESENRVGGRIHSEEVNGDYIEYGAQWLHGEENEIKNISEQNYLLSNIESFEGEGQFISNDGFIYQINMIKDVQNVVNKILKECESLKYNESISFSVGDYLKEKFEYHLNKFVDHNEKYMWERLLKWHLKFLEIDNSCDSLYDLSAKYWGVYDFNGEDTQRHINYKNGYLSILNKIMMTLPKKTVRLNTKVEKIDWMRCDIDKAVVHTLHDRYICDHVIVTTSLGVLKRDHKKMFSPSLPVKYVNAIDCMGFSGFGKIFLQFESPWWGSEKGFQFIWNETHSDLSKKLCEKNAEWVKHITGFDVLAVGPPNCVVGWVTSIGTRAMEKLSEEEIMNDCIFFLESFINRRIPKIIMVKRSNWMSNPSFNGCYCNITMLCDLYNVGPSTLAAPICNSSNRPVLLFAGEATHEKYFSTTHGAAETGIRQAKKIIEFAK